MKFWKVTSKIGLVVVAMLVLALMDHAGIADSDWDTWREVDWHIRASDLDWNILGNDSFHGTYISNRSPHRVDVEWKWKNDLMLVGNNNPLRTEVLEGEVTLRNNDHFEREGWLSTPNDNLDPGTYKIRASVTIWLNSQGARQEESVTAFFGPVVIPDPEDDE